MQQLDAVYNTFSKLDANYAKSKMSRSEYIRGKLGGDINKGITLIMEYLSAQKIEFDEDINKLSFIRNIFSAISDAESYLDELSDFKFDTTLEERVRSELAKITGGVSGIYPVTQAYIYNNKKALHYAMDTEECYYTPLDDCAYFKVYNDNMAKFINAVSGGKIEPAIDSLYKITPVNNALTQVSKVLL